MPGLIAGQADIAQEVVIHIQQGSTLAADGDQVPQPGVKPGRPRSGGRLRYGGGRHSHD